MEIEEMQKQIESMMPTPKQIVESIDKELKEKDILELVKVVNQEIEQEEPYTKIPMSESYLENIIRQEQIEQAKAELFPMGDNGRSYEQALSASGFDLGVKWADEHPRKGLVDIDKVCEWLEYHANDFMMTSHETFEDWRERKKILFNNFRKTIEE